MTKEQLEYLALKTLATILGILLPLGIVAFVFRPSCLHYMQYGITLKATQQKPKHLAATCYCIAAKYKNGPARTPFKPEPGMVCDLDGQFFSLTLVDNLDAKSPIGGALCRCYKCHKKNAKK